MASLTGKVVWISGGSGGIGAATARKIVSDGGRVWLVDLDDAVHALASELGDAAGASVVDVSDAEQVAASMNAAVERHGSLTGTFLNAGIEGRVAPLTDLALDDFRKVLEVNLFGVLHGLRAGHPHLAKNGGSVVITSSVAGLIGSPGLGPYCVSKHAVIGLMRTAAQEWGTDGIRVNTVNPGPIDNRMMTSLESQLAPGSEAAVREGFSARVPVGRYGRSEEVANLVAFLMSDESSYCNGWTYVVDGGMRSG